MLASSCGVRPLCTPKACPLTPPVTPQGQKAGVLLRTCLAQAPPRCTSVLSLGHLVFLELEQGPVAFMLHSGWVLPQSSEGSVDGGGIPFPEQMALTASLLSSCQPCPSSEWRLYQRDKTDSGQVSERPRPALGLHHWSQVLFPWILILVFLTRPHSLHPLPVLNVPPGLCPVLVPTATAFTVPEAGE